MRTFLRSFIESSQFKYYFSPYFASAGFKEEMGAQKARPAAKKAPGVRAVPVKQKKLKVPIFGESEGITLSSNLMILRHPLLVHTSWNTLNANSQPVSVNALNSVVSITTVDDNVPSCPIFLDITKLLTVVAEPSITRIATNSSLRNPILTATGRNIATNTKSFINVADTAGLIFPSAF